MGKLGSLRFFRIVAVSFLIVSSVLVNIFSESVNESITSTVSESQNQIVRLSNKAVQ